MAESNVSLLEQIACAERELRLRCSTYPKWVQQGRMDDDVAQKEISRMREIVNTLRRVFAETVQPKLFDEQ